MQRLNRKYRWGIFLRPPYHSNVVKEMATCHRSSHLSTLTTRPSQRRLINFPFCIKIAQRSIEPGSSALSVVKQIPVVLRLKTAPVPDSNSISVVTATPVGLSLVVTPVPVSNSTIPIVGYLFAARFSLLLLTTHHEYLNLTAKL